MKATNVRVKTSAGTVVSERRPILRAMFAPNSVALIGASEKPGSVGRALLENLQSFRGRVFPINPSHSTLLGQKTFSTIRDVPEDVDLAVIATPAATVPGIVAECAAAGVKGAVIISAGFKECWTGWCGTRKADSRTARQDADHRAELRGRDAAAHRFERDVREAACAAGQHRLHQSKRRALHGDSRLEPINPTRVQRVHFHRFHGRCELGRFD